ncbi:MAG TPA: hypothetical protein DD413_02095 [Ruminococcus sp.]|nr:hypothetical protein [Ruminococcus sp.]
MNIANVVSRFALLSGLSNSEIYDWRSLIDEACDYVNSIVIKENLNAADYAGIEMLCAVYAFRLYSLCKAQEVSSFKAGDVSVTSPADSAERAEKLWLEYLEQYSDLVQKKRFLFGAVM